MKFLTSHWIARALNLPPEGADRALTQISSDTRELGKGSVFVALKGEASDGHDFVEKAQAAGAVALV
ncbi:Mur ligase domain-containing protein, partial [Streptomyces brasiliscabiei]